MVELNIHQLCVACDDHICMYGMYGMNGMNGTYIVCFYIFFCLMIFIKKKYVYTQEKNKGALVLVVIWNQIEFSVQCLCLFEKQYNTTVMHMTAIFFFRYLC